MRRLTGTVLAVLLALTAGACSDDADDEGAAPSSTTSTAPGGSDGDGDSDGDTTSTTTAVSIPEGAEDWDGTRYDVGIVDRIDRLEDGRTIVVFDRVQLETEDGRKEAAAFDEEPIVYGNTDQPFVNENTRLRRYVVSPQVEVLVLGNQREVCPGGDADPQPAMWDGSSVDAAVDGSLWERYQQVSLTFDAATGHVTRIRFSTAC